MCDCRELEDSDKQSQRNNEDCLDAIYSEICSNLVDLGWHPKIRKIRGFTLIYIKDVALSIFLSDNILFVVKGNKLPLMVYKENLDKPGFDIIEAVNKICNKFFTYPDAL